MTMTQDEIIEMAKQAGFVEKDAMFRPAYIANIEDIKGFAKLIAKKEREACAKVCDDHWEKDGAAYYCAMTIRYRG
jgi:hypothetical protein